MRSLLDPKNPAARWEIIKGALRAQGSSLSAVARTIGLTREAVHHVQRRSYPSVEAEIARVIGVPPQELWPDRYDRGGAPKRKRPSYPTALPSMRRRAKVDVNTAALSASRGDAK